MAGVKTTYVVRGTHRLGGYFEASRDRLRDAEDDAAQHFTAYRIYRVTEQKIREGCKSC